MFIVILITINISLTQVIICGLTILTVEHQLSDPTGQQSSNNCLGKGKVQNYLFDDSIKSKNSSLFHCMP